MILIISNDQDLSTDEVCEHLFLNKANYFRVNSQDSIVIEDIRINNNEEIDFTLNVLNKGVISFSEISAYWYRRGTIRPHYGYIKSNLSSELAIDQYFSFLQNDSKSYEFFFHYLLKEKIRGVGFYYDNDINKMLCLLYAKEIGLKIPSTYISQNKEKIIEWLDEKKTAIIKSNDTPFFIYDKVEEFGYSIPTSVITGKDIAGFPNNYFIPAILQEQIKKEFELRIFYFAGKFFSSAIFSQKNEKTKVDFRNYDFEHPNRVVPYDLPEDIERKLVLLLDKLGMDTGSIDMIYTDDNKYIFLEINPVGQFQQVSHPCEYYIEKYIAEYLIQLSDE